VLGVLVNIKFGRV